MEIEPGCFIYMHFEHIVLQQIYCEMHAHYLNDIILHNISQIDNRKYPRLHGERDGDYIERLTDRLSLDVFEEDKYPVFSNIFYRSNRLITAKIKAMINVLLIALNSESTDLFEIVVGLFTKRTKEVYYFILHDKYRSAEPEIFMDCMNSVDVLVYDGIRASALDLNDIRNFTYLERCLRKNMHDVTISAVNFLYFDRFIIDLRQQIAALPSSSAHKTMWFNIDLNADIIVLSVIMKHYHKYGFLSLDKIAPLFEGIRVQIQENTSRITNGNKKRINAFFVINSMRVHFSFNGVDYLNLFLEYLLTKMLKGVELEKARDTIRSSANRLKDEISNFFKTLLSGVEDDISIAMDRIVLKVECLPWGLR